MNVTRRTFIYSPLAATAVTAVSHRIAAKAPQEARTSARQPWYERAYRRAVIDMHIPDWDEEFLAQFDPNEYADALAESRAQSVVCYCQSHVGLFNYPTKVGKQHRAFQGRDMLAEMIQACHARQIAVVLYCSLIFDRWTGDQHPEWRIRRWDGQIHGLHGRHAVLCINSPYRDYVRRFVEEICDSYSFEGIRFDMTFWPTVCYCSYCQQRFAAETGSEIPQKIDWLDPTWVKFQRCRERWLAEFALGVTEIVRRKRPEATVEHQSSTFPLHWMFGVTGELCKANDFLQGDFYGDQLQGSFVRKLLEDLTPHRPFAYETSSSFSLRDHTALKSEALLAAKAAAAIADHAAFVFIDAIDPRGTVNRRAHRRMGTVFERWMPYYEHLGGDRVADVAIYYSMESKFSFAGNGRPVSNPDTTDSHTEAAMQVARRLLTGHWLFRVLTRASLDQLHRVKVLILPQVNMMSEDECDVIRRWVAAGGKLYASGGTSAVNLNGQLQNDFLLADVFGVSLVSADWKPYSHYVAPTASGQPWFIDFDSRYPAFSTGYGFRVRAAQDAQVWATTTLPWSSDDPSRFASIHSDPPWRATDQAELVWHPYGQGTSLYAATPIESMDVLEHTFLKLLHALCPQPTLELHAPASVEVTMFHQPERSRYVITLVNFQDALPNIPMDSLTVRIRLPENVKVHAVVSVPNGRLVRMEQRDRTIGFRTLPFETLSMYAIEYRM